MGWKIKKTEQDNPWAPEGTDFIKFKRMEFYIDRKTGEKKKNKPIEVIDAYGKPWNQETLIGNGSEVNVRFRVYEGFKKQTQTIIDAIQVVNLVPFEQKEPFPVLPQQVPKDNMDDDISHIGSDNDDEDEVTV